MLKTVSIRASEIATLSGATLVGPDSAFEYFAFDTRRMSASHLSCFVAISSPTGDGHEHIGEALRNGAAVVLCADATPYIKSHPEASFLLHENPLGVLSQWAGHCRSKFAGPVLAIAGSNGKTMVKEWMYELMGAPVSVFRTPGSFNSLLGVSLTLSGLRSEYEKAIIEVGIDAPGTMKNRVELVRPTLGLFTTLGHAHGENFRSEDEKFIEKWSLLEGCEKIAAHRKWITKAEALGLHIPEALVWGPGETFDPANIESLTFGYEMHRENAMNALMGALLLGTPLEEALGRLSALKPLDRRMNMVAAREGGYLIEDTYSSDLESLHWALEELTAQPTTKKWAVLSSLATAAWTSEAKSMVDRAGLDRVWWVDQPEQIGLLASEFKALDLKDTTLLIKGMRKFGLEVFAATLRNQNHSTWAEVNLGAMRRNLNAFRAFVPGHTKIMAMVKASSYGTGTLEVARWLDSLHVDYLGVAFSQEALSLRAHGIKTPMLVMNAEPDQFISLAETGCEVELYARHQLLPFMALAGKELTLRLHIKVDTGMHRLGFRPDEVPALMEELVKVPNIEVTGVFSHLSSADLPEEESFTLGQLALFDAAVKVVRRHYPTVLAHILNTHGIPKYAQHGYDMVRLGLGLYGVGSYDGLAALEEVVHWKCRISQIGTLLPGDSLGYGRSFIASKPTQYATLPLGYADGLSRQLSNGKGAVYINGQRCSILGRICMDMVMVDCTEMNVQAGDEVEIIGPHQRAAQLAKDGNTIAYEVLTSIGARVPRIYIKD